jgi:hypothetical protein
LVGIGKETDVTAIVSTLLGTLLGGLAGLLVSLWTTRQSHRMALTQTLLAEFLSASFLQHRISIESTQRKWRDGAVTASALAGGFWCPGEAGYYAGETSGSLNEHQHLEVYLEFLIKVDHALARKLADRSDLAASLSGEILWEEDIVRAMADETKRQAADAGVPVPRWVGAAESVFRQLNVPHRAELGSVTLSLPGSAESAGQLGGA